MGFIIDLFMLVTLISEQYKDENLYIIMFTFIVKFLVYFAKICIYQSAFHQQTMKHLLFPIRYTLLDEYMTF